MACLRRRDLLLDRLGDRLHIGVEHVSAAGK
jgi:hypothetical protein